MTEDNCSGWVNCYNVFPELKIRKKNRTSFLDQLKEKLINRMDEADEGF